jgi:hypothetical protein
MPNKQKKEKNDDNDERCSPANANANSISNNDNKTNTTSTNISIRMVIQRYRKASLLIDEKEYVTVGEEEKEEKEEEEPNDQPNTDDDSDNKEEDYKKSNSNNPGHIGMLVYISFSKVATSDVVQRAAKTILNLPIQTEGAWGDGSSTKSILQAAAAANANAEASNQQRQQQGKVATTNTNNNNSNNVSIMLVPQANLIAKVTRNGKSVQYRDQIDKKQGEELYNLFVQYVKEILTENKQLITQQGSKTKIGTANKGKSISNNNNNNAMTAADPSILPEELFRHRQEQQQQQNQNQNQNITAANTNTTTPLLYGSFDESTGLPLTTADGKPLTKSATKRIKKQYDAHTKRHEKYLLKLKQQYPIPIPIPIPATATATATADNDNSSSNNQKIELREDKQEEWTNDYPCKNKDKESKNNSDDNEDDDEDLFVQLIAGSFGKRQGLQLVSDMGPFCHVIEL